MYFEVLTKYSAACAGKTVAFTVEYVVLPGEPDPRPVATVRFRPPDYFIVEFPRMKPIVDHIRKR
jgi:hypothetical protein